MKGHHEGPLRLMVSDCQCTNRGFKMQVRTFVQCYCHTSGLGWRHSAKPDEHKGS